MSDADEGYGGLPRDKMPQRYGIPWALYAKSAGLGVGLLVVAVLAVIVVAVVFFQTRH